MVRSGILLKRTKKALPPRVARENTLSKFQVDLNMLGVVSEIDALTGTCAIEISLQFKNSTFWPRKSWCFHFYHVVGIQYEH